jgi:hypothetical protein
MNDSDDKSGGDRARRAVARTSDIVLPKGAVALIEFRARAIERGLGYFRCERFVIFGYCPGGGEVIWKDGHSSGFGPGGWRMFLHEVAPIARRHGISLGDMTGPGTHVLVIDRAGDLVYAAPRESAEMLLAHVNGISPPRRPCLCGLLHCASCPVHTGPPARISGEETPDATGTIQVPACTPAPEVPSDQGRR